MQLPEIPLYDKPTLELIASQFLEAFHNASELEVDVELILEKDLNYHLIPFSSLAHMHGIEAAVLFTSRVIYIDQYLLDHKEHKCRFTIAEEIAHILLHKDVYKNCRRIEDVFKVNECITAEQHRKMERNAKYLAAAILMPEKSFRKRALEIYNEKKITLSDYQSLMFSITCQLSKEFNVGDYTAGIRFSELGLPSYLSG